MSLLDDSQRKVFPQDTAFGIETGLTKREYAAIHIMAAVVSSNFGINPDRAVGYTKEYVDELFGEK